MSEPWKTIICDSDECISEQTAPVSPGSPNSKLNQDTIEDYKIHPDIDTESITQFTCPRCGKVETWGDQRRSVARVLYERFK